MSPDITIATTLDQTPPSGLGESARSELPRVLLLMFVVTQIYSEGRVSHGSLSILRPIAADLGPILTSLSTSLLLYIVRYADRGLFVLPSYP